MLNILRKNTKKIFIFILILIIPAFCFFGINMAVESNQRQIAGKIEGKSIAVDRFWQYQKIARNQILMQMILIFGIQNADQLNRMSDRINSLFTQANLQQFAWERILLQKLIKKEKISSNQDEMINWIAHFPLFQSQGQFDTHRYNQILRTVFGTNPTMFEKNLAISLKIQRLQKQVTDPIQATEDEIEKAYSQIHQKAKIQYLFFDAQDFTKKVNVSKKATKEFYEQNQSLFKLPKQIRVNYFKLAKEDMPKPRSISQTQIEAYYKGNPSLFQTSEGTQKPLATVQNEIKNLLINVKREEVLYEKITDIAVALIREPNAEEVAKEYRVQLQRSPLFSAQNSPFPPRITEEVFRISKGEFSKPLQTQDGVYILTPIEKIESQTPPFKECHKEVKERLVQNKALKLAQADALEKQQEIKQLVEEKRITFLDASEALKLKVIEPPLFSPSPTEEDQAVPSEIKKLTFNQKLHTVSKVLPSLKGAYFFTVQEKIDPEYKEDLQLIQRINNEKKAKHYQAWLSQEKVKANLIDLTPFL